MNPVIIVIIIIIIIIIIICQYLSLFVIFMLDCCGCFLHFIIYMQDFSVNFKLLTCAAVAVLSVLILKSLRWVCGQLWARFAWKHLCGLVLSFFCLSSQKILPPILHFASSEQWCWSGGRCILTELSLCYSVAFQQCTLHNHNEQFFQVGLLDRALISLGLVLSPPSTSVSSDFMVLCKCCFC